MEHIKGTAVMRDDQGRAYGRIEVATGRVLTLSGKFTGTTLETHGKDDGFPEDGDVSLSDFAARHYYSGVARSTGKPSVMMRDASGAGVQVNMDLAPGDVHIAAALPNYAAGYHLAEGIADIAAPVVVVPKQSNKYFTWDSDNAFKRVIPNSNGPGGAVAEVNPTLSSAQYTTIEYCLGSFVTTEVEANADAPLRPYQAAVARVMNALKLEREFRVATLLTTSTNWNTNNVTALAAGAQWNSGATSDPVKNLQDIQEKSFMKLSRWVFSEPAYHAFVRNPSVRQYWAYKADPSSTTVPSPEQISALLKIAPIVLADMKYSSGGAAAYVWPSAAGASSAVVALHEPPQNPPTSQEDVATAYTFRWMGGDAPDGTITAGWMVRSFYDPKRGGRGGRMLVVVHNDTEIVTSKIVGGLITGVIQ